MTHTGWFEVDLGVSRARLRHRGNFPFDKKMLNQWNLKSIDKIKNECSSYYFQFDLLRSSLRLFHVTISYDLLRLATVLLEVTTGSLLDKYQKINTKGVAKCQIPLLNANIAPLTLVETRLPPDELYLKRFCLKGPSSIGFINGPMNVLKFFIPI